MVIIIIIHIPVISTSEYSEAAPHPCGASKNHQTIISFIFFSYLIVYLIYLIVKYIFLIKGKVNMCKMVLIMIIIIINGYHQLDTLIGEEYKPLVIPPHKN